MPVRPKRQENRSKITTREALSEVINNISDMIWVVDPEKFGLISFNQSFRDYVGEFAPLANGTPPEHILPYENVKTWYDYFTKTLNDGPFTVDFATRGITLELRFNTLHTESGETFGISVIAKDVTELKETIQRLEYISHYDHLTSLPNRLNLKEHLTMAIKLAARSDSNLAVMLINIDHFKNVNTSLGHQTGDLLLRRIGSRLQETVRETDIVARLSGDEFVLVLSQVNEPRMAKISDVVMQELSEDFLIEDHTIQITPSIGISIYPADGDSPEELMKNADLAMTHAKSMGRNNYQFFKQEMNQKAYNRMQIELGLRSAIQNNEFILHYQPQIDVATNRLVGVEALVRWIHPENGMVPPDKFIPIAEETGQIMAIGEIVLRTACQQLKDWEAAGLPPFRMAINLSAHQMNYGNLPELLHSILNETGANPLLIELEITESVAMNDPETTIQHLRQFRKMGIELAIDDFGTGYSSLSYLKHFPVNRLKIDRSFVKDIETDTDSAAIAAATIALAHTIGKEVVAEGVETVEQLNFLRSHDCDIVQGYYFSRPVVAEGISKFLKEREYL